MINLTRYSSSAASSFALLVLLLAATGVRAQDAEGPAKQRLYQARELLDYHRGLSTLQLEFDPQRSPRVGPIYRQLEAFSDMSFRLIPAQTYQWGQAHAGGLIIIDVSFLAKPVEVLAFVLSHEWGHEALGHQPNFYRPNGGSWRFRRAPTQDEDEADAYAGRFLARFRYDLDPVIRFLRSVPESPQDVSHSRPAKRIETLRRAYHGAAQSPRYAQRTATCRHRVHAYDIVSAPAAAPAVLHRQGDVVPCAHVAHAGGDVDPCQHPAHPAGDRIPCGHRAHPLDRWPCAHRAHAFDFDGFRRWPCVHQAHPWDARPCIHPAHPFDVLRCAHRLHPMGDVLPCRHRLHPAGDLLPCVHRLPGAPAAPGAVAPASRVIPCEHVWHPQGCERLVPVSAVPF